MDKSILNKLLFLLFIIPLVLLLWPFAMWGDFVSLALRCVSAFAAQLLMINIFKIKLLSCIPSIFTALIALWGIYLYLTSPHWINAALGDLLADYISPFISCAATYIIHNYKR